MTNDENKKVSDEAARIDLSDIATLKNTEAFERYYMRRVRQKHSEARKSLIYEKLTPDEREAARLLVIKLEEFMRLIADDEATLKRQLGLGA